MTSPSRSTMAGSDHRTIGTSDRDGAERMNQQASRALWLCLDGLAHLVLFGFALIIAESWLDSFILDKAGYDLVIGSEEACSKSWAYCSWANYTRALAMDTVLALAGLIVAAWRGLRYRAWLVRLVA